MKHPRLTTAATLFVLEHPELMAQLPSLTGIRVGGIHSAVRRQSSSITTYYAVVIIANQMGVEPHSIVELTD